MGSLSHPTAVALPILSLAQHFLPRSLIPRNGTVRRSNKTSSQAICAVPGCSTCRKWAWRKRFSPALFAQGDLPGPNLLRALKCGELAEADLRKEWAKQNPKR